VQVRKVRNINNKSFHWACNGPNCPWESDEIQCTRNNYDEEPPTFCPRCRRGGNQQTDSIPASILADLPGFTDIWSYDHLENDLPDHSFKLESGRLPAQVPSDAAVVQLCGECRETYARAGSPDGPLTEYPPVPKARRIS